MLPAHLLSAPVTYCIACSKYKLNVCVCVCMCICRNGLYKDLVYISLNSIFYKIIRK